MLTLGQVPGFVRMVWILARVFISASHPSLEDLSTGALAELFTNGTIILVTSINMGK